MSTMTEDLADLVGSTRAERILDNHLATNRLGAPAGVHVEDMLKGVTVSWLSQVFDMDPKTVKAKLADCPPLHKRKAGYTYHLPTACQYLVKPALSPDQFMRNMKPADLPAAFQQSFWDAALKRQKWEENAGELWRTDRVREVLGNMFQLIKFTLQLWPDTVERQKGLSDEQRVLLTELVDTLQKDIYQKLVSELGGLKTGPQLSELDGMFGKKEVIEDDFSDLV